MTDREEAREQAVESLARATNLKRRGDKIGEAWRKSRDDNNFRQMLRQLGEGIANGSA